jgi:hypothetical protein
VEKENSCFKRSSHKNNHYVINNKNLLLDAW